MNRSDWRMVMFLSGALAFGVRTVDGQVVRPSVAALLDSLRSKQADTRESAVEALVQAGPSTLPALIPALSDPSPEMREAVSGVIGRFGVASAPAIPKLVELLADKSWNVRLAARFALGSTGPACVALPRLLELAAGEDEITATYAVEVIGGCGAGAADQLPLILKILNRRDDSWKGTVIATIGKMGPSAGTAVPTLVQLLGSASQTVRKQSIEALGNMGVNARPALERLSVMARNQSPTLRIAAAEALGKLSGSLPEARTPLLGMLDDADVRVRQTALNGVVSGIEAIGNMGVNARPELEQLSVMARNQSPRVRIAVAEALAKLSVSLPEGRNPLISMLHDDDVNVRQTALNGVVKFGSPSPAEIAAVANLFNDRDVYIREHAVEFVQAQKSAARPAERQLLAALADSSPFVRQRAAMALKDLAPVSVEAVRQLLQALRDTNLLTRATIIGTIAASGGNAQVAVPTLVRLLADTSGLKYDALDALKKIGAQAEAVVPALLTLNQRDVDIVATLAQLGLGAIPQLRDAANDPSPDVRRRAVSALVKLGARDTTTIKSLLKAIGDTDEVVAEKAAEGLTLIGGESVPFLERALRDPRSYVIVRAIRVLAQIPESARTSLPKLRGLLADTSENVRYEAAVAIATIQSPDELLLRPLILSLRSGDSTTRRRAAVAIEGIAKDMSDGGRIESLPLLREADRALGDSHDDSVRAHEKEVHRAVRYLNLVWWQIFRRNVREVVASHPIMTGVAAAYVFAAVVCFLLLWIHPLTLLRASEPLSRVTDFKVDWFGGVTVPISYLLVVGLFHYHPRVLAAWAANNAEKIRLDFEAKRTVQDRMIHVPMPVVLDKTTVAAPTAETFRSIFRRKRSALVIYGEGGAGKTSLAIQLARWAMAQDPDVRLNRRAITLPVLIEFDLGGTGDRSTAALIDSVRGNLSASLELGRPLPNDLLLHLLRQGRLLVIVDHLSEMGEATRQAIRFDSAEFPINALIVTSRIEEKLHGIPRSLVTPLRIQGNRLSSFMEAYLTQRGWRDSFDDAEYFEACRRLSLMVGERDITVLLAKLYAEQLIAEKERPSAEGLPKNIPELMLSYLNEINRSAGPSDPDDRTVHRAAKAIARLSLRETFKPSPANYGDVIGAIGENVGDQLLRYMEDKLRLVQTVGPERDKIRFSLDPVAEYLAGLSLVEELGDDAAKWRDWLEKAKKLLEASPTTLSFLLAVRDSVAAKTKDQAVRDLVEKSISTWAAESSSGQ